MADLQSSCQRGQTLGSKDRQRALEAMKRVMLYYSHHGQKHKANAKLLMKLQKKWMARRVIEEEQKANILQQIHEEIEEETGQKPGQKEVLRRYQPTMTAIMKGLNKNELEEAQAKADEFDFNEQLGMGSSFMKCKDWQVILPAWEDFIGDAFNQDQDQDSMLLGCTHWVPKPCYEFDLDSMGLPMLPDVEGFSLNTKKGMIWSFLTIHYRICSGKPKVPVPWNDIMKGQSRFISSTYLLDTTKIVDP
ncbi:hypothetical protein BDR07DRAFT_1380452 [Suillus spraguei]|nr:hypothetical protein BDR07DRAFT_1380452 [Suillus spraguei]